MNDDKILEAPEPDAIPLEELFRNATQAKSAKDALRESQARARLYDGTPQGREASEIAKRLLAELEWRDVALVALCLEQVCACGRTHFWFEGEYVERHHVRDKTARWHHLVSAPGYINLPRKIEYQTHRVKMCPSCLREHGYV